MCVQIFIDYPYIEMTDTIGWHKLKVDDGKCYSHKGVFLGHLIEKGKTGNPSDPDPTFTFQNEATGEITELEGFLKFTEIDCIMRTPIPGQAPPPAAASAAPAPSAPPSYPMYYYPIAAPTSAPIYYYPTTHTIPTAATHSTIYYSIPPAAPPVQRKRDWMNWFFGLGGKHTRSAKRHKRHRRISRRR